MRQTGAAVNIQFRIPAANTDNARPADISRVEVYGFTGPPPAPADAVKFGTLVASVPVRKPPEEADAEDEEEKTDRSAPDRPARPAPSMENGFDQGDLVVVSEVLGEAQHQPVEMKLSKGKRAQAPVQDEWQPRLRPVPGKADARVYFVVGVNHKGQRGSFSPPQVVPLAPPPAPPANATIEYDEKGIRLSWDAPGDLPRPIQPLPEEGMLKATSLSYAGRFGGYNVYETSPEAQQASAPLPQALTGSLAKPLNESPLGAPSFLVPGLEFGKERCFVVRAATAAGPLVTESDATPPLCLAPRDTFPPAAPKGLSAVGSEGAVSLIWEASTEPDLAGYLVLRAEGNAPAAALTPAPIKETTFRDATAARGVRYVYTVVAVDGAGNRSAPSDAVEEAAR